MLSFISRYATPLTTGLFLISLISGIALFFHFGTGAFRGMHEWLSMVLMIPVVMHIWKNWRPFVSYFKRLPMALSLFACLAAGLAFSWPSLTGSGSGAGGNPAIAMVSLVAAATPVEVGQLLSKSGDELVTDLKSEGFTAATPSKSLNDIAAESGKSVMSLMATLSQLKRAN
ncbi:DUF4405 domain-containing protein [Peteryoungia ipomoeae]|uniref:DUF4405 domain-containing protein n=1 Tax=Peteryoungia ipomoeae TaxID=1210932 RepID=A0A4S8P6K8_9HYPH|nr:DUF4405 domain-containing protein [Peteryoungia ipomoeae]THV24895.1 DUF4405 domain-containing protein [Peteryoungia ipomoeae]